ncbi:hypothetical protein Scep_000410 [Stephania cephalantha]|uniref:Uncharacterized protein n=1 Tax=Stephania cephalantha TaxID=152367 RepID=A0AAP0Q450_9MAGN
MVKASETLGAAPALSALFRTSMGLAFHHSPVCHHHNNIEFKSSDESFRRSSTAK